MTPNRKDARRNSRTIIRIPDRTKEQQTANSPISYESSQPQEQTQSHANFLNTNFDRHFRPRNFSAPRTRKSTSRPGIVRIRKEVDSTSMRKSRLGETQPSPS